MSLSPSASPTASAPAGANIFGAPMTAVHDLSPGRVTRTLYEVDGQYRRSM